METFNPASIYALRFTNLLVTPKSVQDVIASMQLAPVSQVFNKKAHYKKPNHRAVRNERDLSWRHSALIRLKTHVFEKDDPDYEQIVSIVNKASTATIVSSANEISDVLLKRESDETFRLRVVSFLFSRGVSMPFFSKMMANIFEIVHQKNPAIKDDLEVSCSIKTFNEMFDMSETVVCPSITDPKYDELICAWNKKKELRRGFGMFTTELHIRNLVDESVIHSAIQTTLNEFTESILFPRNEMIAESVDHLVTFLYTSSTILISRFGKTNTIYSLIASKAKETCAKPKSECPCLGMKSRFRLEDICKL